MGMRLILTAFVVAIGSTPALPNHQTGENLGHFFNSIVKSDKKDIQTYRDILEHETFREQQAFDEMKEELQRSRQRTVHTRNSIHNNHSVLLSKRELQETKFDKSKNVYNTGPEEGWEHAPAATPEEEELEDIYLAHWEGSDWRVQREWNIMRDWWFGEEHDKMKEYCFEFNELAGKKRLNMSVVLVKLNIHYLRFRSKNSHQIARIDVCRYTENTTRLDEAGEWLLAQSAPTYITSGLASDCVYFLEPTDHTDMEFYLEAHVCKGNATSGAGLTTTAAVDTDVHSEVPKCSTAGTDVEG